MSDNKRKLYVGAKSGKVALCEEGLKAGMEVDAFEDPSNRTAMIFAAFRGHTNVIQFLLDKGAQINYQDLNGYTPLIEAARIGHLNAVQVLIQRGAQINLKDNRGLTALAHAVLNKHLPVANALIASGADMNIVTNGGLAITHMAGMSGDSKFFTELFYRGARTNRYNLMEKTQCIDTHNTVKTLRLERTQNAEKTKQEYFSRNLLDQVKFAPEMSEARSDTMTEKEETKSALGIKESVLDFSDVLKENDGKLEFEDLSDEKVIQELGKIIQNGEELEHGEEEENLRVEGGASLSLTSDKNTLGGGQEGLAH